jgi:hypothetical protein
VEEIEQFKDQERGKRKEERGKRKEERGKEERGKRCTSTFDGEG